MEIFFIHVTFMHMVTYIAGKRHFIIRNEV